MTAQAQRPGLRARYGARALLLLLAICVLSLPRLLIAAQSNALDAIQSTETIYKTQPVERAVDNFPGSAFFFAEGAFDQAPDAAAEPPVPHILPLVRVEASVSRPFTGLSALDRARALHCLTNAIYYEAANEPDDGQRAVAQVVLNRVRHPLWPNTVCGVVYQGAERTDMRCQFTFTCDGAMSRAPVAAKWARARSAAAKALAGDVFAPVGLSTYYHTLAVRPDWRVTLNPVAVVGAHIFYEMRGPRGTAAAFAIAYSGRELIAGPPASSYLPRAARIPAFPPLAAPDLSFAQPGKGAIASQQLPNYSLPAPPPAATSGPSNDRLPQSGIKAEYRNSGRPLI